MILVTLGTQLQSFTRLLDAIEQLDLDEEIIVQAGCTKYKSNKMKILDFISYEEMKDLVNKARVIITHGGTGSIVEPLKNNKKIIGCARLEKYGEHVDDHQTELISIFAEQGYILEYKDGDDLEKLLKDIENFKPKKYISNTDNFILKLQEKLKTL
ncbi:MAG: exopolysaccharide biosynthesis protein [Clostridia bacterium]|nr:exopolysaccharide biosynthesis protein [Clostridia bacterium]